MASSVGVFSRIFSSKCRIFCANAARPSLVGSNPQFLPTVLGNHGNRPFSEEAPVKPKRPVTSFVQFAAEQRPRILAENPNLTVTGVTKRAAEMWKEISDEEKETYRAEFESRRNQFREEMEAYRSNFTDEQWDEMTEVGRKKREMKAKRRHKNEMRKLNKPKRPPTGYSMFIKAHVSSSPRPVGGYTREDITTLFKEGAEVWKTLPDYEKQQYNDQAATFSETYREEMEEWKRRMEEEGRKV